MEPEQVEYKVRTKGGTKRKRILTYEELQTAAEERDVGELYQQLVEFFRPHFERTRTTGSSIGFVADFQGSQATMLNLIPRDSNAEQGVHFQLYAKRIADRFGVSETHVAEHLPPAIKRGLVIIHQAAFRKAFSPTRNAKPCSKRCNSAN